MDSTTKWLVRGACGVVILWAGGSFSYGTFAVIRCKQLMREVAVRKAEADIGGNCTPERIRYNYPEVSQKVREAVATCKRYAANKVPPWWTFKSPLEIFLVL